MQLQTCISYIFTLIFCKFCQDREQTNKQQYKQIIIVTDWSDSSRTSTQSQDTVGNNATSGNIEDANDEKRNTDELMYLVALCVACPVLLGACIAVYCWAKSRYRNKSKNQKQKEKEWADTQNAVELRLKVQNARQLTPCVDNDENKIVLKINKINSNEMDQNVGSYEARAPIAFGNMDSKNLNENEEKSDKNKSNSQLSKKSDDNSSSIEQLYENEGIVEIDENETKTQTNIKDINGKEIKTSEGIKDANNVQTDSSPSTNELVHLRYKKYKNRTKSETTRTKK